MSGGLREGLIAPEEVHFEALKQPSGIERDEWLLVNAVQGDPGRGSLEATWAEYRHGTDFVERGDRENEPLRGAGEAKHGQVAVSVKLGGEDGRTQRSMAERGFVQRGARTCNAAIGVAILAIERERPK